MIYILFMTRFALNAVEKGIGSAGEREGISKFLLAGSGEEDGGKIIGPVLQRVLEQEKEPGWVGLEGECYYGPVGPVVCVYVWKKVRVG